MELNLTNKLFVVLGASSGFGYHVADQMAAEGAHLIINARREEKLSELKVKYPEKIETVVGDVTTDAVMSKLLRTIGERPLHGIFINAGGPPATSFVNSEMHQWDEAYQSVLRWKVKMTKTILPIFEKQGFGKYIFLESASVKTPIENLVLSNSLRLAVVGFVKTLAQELASKNITCNIIAPGYHKTARVEQLFEQKSKALGIPVEEVLHQFEQTLDMKRIGDPRDLASLATWMFSDHASFITGQVITLDGGFSKGVS